MSNQRVSSLLIALSLVLIGAASASAVQPGERSIPRSFSGGSAGADVLRLRNLENLGEQNSDLAEDERDQPRARLKLDKQSELDTPHNKMPRSFSGGSSTSALTARETGQATN